MAENDLLSIIELKMPELSKGQKKIALFLLNDYDKAVSLTAARLGEIVGVSESTVVRFAAELGYEGYPELQKALLEVVKTRLTASQRMDISYDSLRKSHKNILDEVLRHDAERLIVTTNEIDHQAFEQSVDSIINAKKVYLIGGRSAAAIASFFYFYLKLMHDNVVLLDSGSVSEVYEHMFRISSDDVCVAISFPRYSKRTVTAMEYAAGQKATTIAITDNYDSPIAVHADFVLKAKSDVVSLVDSLVAPLSVICAVLVAISIRKKNSLYDSFERLESLWKENQVY